MNAPADSDSLTPARLNLKRDEALRITWRDGRESVYPIGYLRKHCPCASCKAERALQETRKTRLAILSGNQAVPLSAVNAELVGNYALRISWSDDHATGIYSFTYLREIDPTPAGSTGNPNNG